MGQPNCIQGDFLAQMFGVIHSPNFFIEDLTHVSKNVKIGNITGVKT